MISGGQPTIAIRPLAHFDRSLDLPSYESEGAAGLDLRACLDEDERDQGIALPGLGRVLVPTGLSMAIPPGFEGQIRPRSGVAARHGVTVLNSPGTIDSDYRGEVRVLLINLGAETFQLRHGERIAQLVIAPVIHAGLSFTDALDQTARGAGGFGSTGRE